jgi:MurNAc alpha-1-phosphate uridylyltransferase
MNAMILAAGRGERMRPLTDTLPKPMLPVGGRPLIDFHLAALAGAGIERVVINLAWQGASIREFVGDGSKYGLSVTYSDEGSEALETGGGIQRALPWLGDDPFWLVNGDVYCEFDYPAQCLAPGVLGHLLLVPNPGHNPDGDFDLKHDRVQVGPPTPYTYTGIALLHPQLFAGSLPGRFPLAPLLTRAIHTGGITGVEFTGRWVDVGTPERLRQLDESLA